MKNKQNLKNIKKFIKEYINEFNSKQESMEIYSYKIDTFNEEEVIIKFISDYKLYASSHYIYSSIKPFEYTIKIVIITDEYNSYITSRGSQIINSNENIAGPMIMDISNNADYYIEDDKIAFNEAIEDFEIIHQLFTTMKVGVKL